jgi:hypothetical protein
MAGGGQEAEGEQRQPFEVVLWDARTRELDVVLTVGNADRATIVFHDEVVGMVQKGVRGELFLRHRDASAFPILRQPLLPADENEAPQPPSRRRRE